MIKRKLYPLLEKLEIPQSDFTPSVTAMGQSWTRRACRWRHARPVLVIPMREPMRYSHVVSEDGRQFAARLGDLLVPQGAQTLPVMPSGNA